MSVFTKFDEDYNKFDPITFKGKSYYPDYIIRLPLEENDKINIDNCDCVFLIADPANPGSRIYVGARHFRKSRKEEKIPESINGYNPQYIFCYTETKFPLKDFIEDQDFDYFETF